MQEKLVKSLKHFSNYIIIVLLILLVTSMFFGTGHIILLFYQSMASADPYYFLIKVDDLHLLFSLLLVMLVGHELFKSITLLLNHNNIPIKSILIAIGVTFYFFRNESEE